MYPYPCSDMTRAPRISRKKQNALFNCFVEDTTAKQAAALSGVSRMCANRYYRHYREAILKHQLAQYPKFSGEVEIDIGFIGGRGAKWTTRFVQNLIGLSTKRIVAKKKEVVKMKARERPVLGILQRSGPIFLLPLESRARPFLEMIVRQIVTKGSVVYTDMEKGLDGLKFIGYIHRQVNHSHGQKSRRGYHINSIESFWNTCKGALKKNFKGIPRSTIDLHIKEREFRYNNPHKKGLLAPALKALLK